MRVTGQRRTVQLDPASSDFDTIVKLNNDGGAIPAPSVFRGILQCTPNAEITLTFPTAAQLISACPVIPCAGYCKKFSIRNDSQNSAITLVAGDGGSIDGSSTVAASAYAAHYVLRFTSVTSGVEAYMIIRV
jgi:hypothetical protein